MAFARLFRTWSRPCGALALGAAGFAAGCSGADEPRSAFQDGGASSSGDVSSSSGGGSSSGGTSSSSGGIVGDDGGRTDNGCSDRARLVYVLSAEYELYSFNPPERQFQRIGRLNCPTQGPGATPNSMAIDRSGTAWVGYSDAELFKVNTETAECEATGFDYRSQPFTRYGMGFSSNSAGSNDETLFLVGIRSGFTGDEGVGLFSVDTTTVTAQKVGNFSGNLRNESAELTGSGNGELFGFFTTSPAVLARIDKATAATSDTISLRTIDFGGQTSYAFAFSYWGGDFWFYSSVGGRNSKVTRLRTSSDNDESVYIDDVGNFRIVGAGVSTCAPTSPVN